MPTFNILTCRDTKATWTTENPVLLPGEIGIEVLSINADGSLVFQDDPDRPGQKIVPLKVGDGVTPWNNLPYGIGVQGIEGPAGPQGPPVPIKIGWIDVTTLIAAGDSITLPNGWSYTVGLNKMIVELNCVHQRPGETNQYLEIGTAGQSSSAIKFNDPIQIGSELCFILFE